MTANRNKTHCKHGHELSGSNLYINPNRGSRECKKCRRRIAPPLKQERRDRILSALRSGCTIKNIVTGYRGKTYTPDLRLCGRKQFNATIAVDPEFARLVKHFGDKNRVSAVANGFIKQATARAAGEYVVARPVILPTQFWTDGHHTYEAVREATKDIRSPEIRQEVMSSMFIAIQEQKFPVSEAKSRVKDFVKGYWRENDRSMFSKFGSISLDAPAFDDSATSKYDRISEDQRLWA